MRCVKCGIELHEKQKVCIKCGAATPAGGAFYVEEEEVKSKKPIIIGAAVVILLLAAVIIWRSTLVPPPDAVAGEWFSALSGRNVSKARELVTDKFQQELASKTSDMNALSDEYVMMLMDYGKKYTVSKPRFVDRKHAEAEITVGGKDGRQMTVQMVKLKNRWFVDRVLLL